MKITLYMATTIDGYIAKTDGDSDWVSPVDTKNFAAAIEEHGNIILGSRTYKQYFGDLYPVEGVNNIVVSSDPNAVVKSDNIFVVPPNPKEIVSFLESKNQDKALLIGGGRTNGLFLQADLINEIRLVVHPLTFGRGIKLFEGVELHKNLELIESKELEEGLVQLKYAVK